MTESNLENISHRIDLADSIIAKARQIKQDQNLNITYFFAAKSVRFSAFLMLTIAFFIGFENVSNKYYQQNDLQASIIEDIYSNSDFL
jgi:hypothetical protein